MIEDKVTKKTGVDEDSMFKEIFKEIKGYVPFVVVGTLVLTPTLLFCSYDGLSAEHVVVDKGNNSIVVKRINSLDNTSRVIEFENAANGMEYYKRIRTGDTVNLRIPCDGINFVFNNHKFKIFSNIKTINGKNLKMLKEQEANKILQEKIAERDSLIRQIRQSNQKVR